MPNEDLCSGTPGSCRGPSGAYSQGGTDLRTQGCSGGVVQATPREEDQCLTAGVPQLNRGKAWSQTRLRCQCSGSTQENVIGLNQTHKHTAMQDRRGLFRQRYGSYGH